MITDQDTDSKYFCARFVSKTYSGAWITQTAGDDQKSLSNEKFELWVMLFLYISHVATVASPFRPSVFHFLAKCFKICEIFFSCEKKTNGVKLVTQECKRILPQKR